MTATGHLVIPGEVTGTGPGAPHRVASTRDG